MFYKYLIKFQDPEEPQSVADHLPLLLVHEVNDPSLTPISILAPINTQVRFCLVFTRLNSFVMLYLLFSFYTQEDN
jgi:hypothetical protein